MEARIEFARSLAASRFADSDDAVSASEEDALRRQFVDVAHRLSHVHFAINYGDPWADEFLDNSVVRVLLAARLLYAQRQPPYIRPNNRLEEALLHRWVNNERGTGGSKDVHERAEGAR